MTPDDAFLIRLDRESARQTEAVRKMLRDAGRDDLVADLDAKLRDIRLGLDSARAAWSALSSAQRRVMEIMETGRYLVRAHASRTRFEAHGEPHAIANVCGDATVRNLMHRDLVGWEAGRKIVLTERGRFVLKHGRISSNGENK